MEIVHIAAELAPIAKIGGLGDVLHGLSKALLEKKTQVEIILPKYNTLNFNEIDNFSPFGEIVFDFLGRRSSRLWRGKVGGVDVTFIESSEYFDRGKVYGCEDDPLRFAFFSKAALEYLLQYKRTPNILHVHDWHSSLVAPLYREHYEGRIGNPKLVLTIHNLFYQGIARTGLLDILGLEKKRYLQKEALQDFREMNQINLLKGGMIFSDFITTVSPNYARELLAANEDPMSQLLNKCKNKFKGILNGIDFTYWNPSTDPLIPIHFDGSGLSDFRPYLREKRELQKILRKRLHLADEDSPIVSAIARLTPQKGPELIKHALYRTLEKGGQFIFCGSAPEGDTHEIFSNLKRKLAGSQHVHIELDYNEELSHLVYAASDLFLVPSIFEPCGLTQLISMRYGTVPLVRETGGLADTVHDGVNGFSFKPAINEAIVEAIDRAFWCWFQEPQNWKKIMEKGINSDHSWKKPVEEYLYLYQKLSRNGVPSFCR